MLCLMAFTTQNLNGKKAVMSSIINVNIVCLNYTILLYVPVYVCEYVCIYTFIYASWCVVLAVCV